MTSSFRFGIQQLLLIFVLIGLIGGLVTAVTKRSENIEGWGPVCATEDGGIHITADSCILSTDPALRRIRKHPLRPSSSSFSFAPSSIGPETIGAAAVDHRTLVMIRQNRVSGSDEIVYFNLEDSQVVRKILVSGGVGPRQVSFSSNLIAITRRVSMTSEQFVTSFYQLRTGRRTNIPLAAQRSNPRYVTLSPDGRWIGYLFGGAEPLVEVVELQSGETIYQNPLSADLVRFIPGQPSLLIGTRDHLSSVNILSGHQQWDVELTARPKDHQLQLQGDGLNAAIAIVDQRQFNLFQLRLSDGNLDPQPLFQQSRRDGQRTHFAFTSNSQITVAPRHRDDGITIVDLETRARKRAGFYSRWWVAILFVGLFTGWCLTWGWAGRRQRVLWSSSDGRSERRKPTGASATPEVVTTDVRTHRNFRLVCRMMGIGGLIAIAWSVIPMFYFIKDPSFPLLFYFRVGLALFLLAIGLLSLTRSVGRSGRWMNSTASGQVLTLIGIDLINPILGCVELALLNQNQPLQVAELIDPAADAVVADSEGGANPDFESI